MPNLSYLCNLQDNIRFFRNARGFISTHGAAFTNMQFIEKPGIIIQFLPNSANPFIGAANSYNSLSKRLGHQSYTISTDSTKDPRWDMIFKPDVLLRIMCDKNQPNKVSKKFNIWMPTEELMEKCLEYLSSIKSSKSLNISRAS